MPRIRLTRKQWLSIALVLIVPAIAVALLWYLSRDGTPSDLASGAQTLKREPTQVVRDIYLLGKLSPGAAYAVDTSDGIVLIDSGLEESAAGVIRQLDQLQLDSSRLKAILLTHVHGDHSLGAAKLREQFGARTYAGRGDCEPLRAGGPRVSFFSTFEMPNNNPHPTHIDVELIGDEVIEVGDARFRAIAAPGHTPGSVCYLMERRGLRALFTGDVIQSLDPTTSGVLGTYIAYLPPRYRGNAADYLATLKLLRDLQTPHLVLPGHPAMDNVPQDPQIGVDRWLGLLDRGIAEMEQLNARHQRDGADFLDGNSKQLLTRLHYLGDWKEHAIYFVDSPVGPILFDAPGPGLGDFLDRSLTKDLGSGRKIALVVLTSADPQSIDSLDVVVRKYGCAVVAPHRSFDAVRKACPEGTKVLSSNEGLQKWPDLRAIPLAGRGASPTAYEFKLDGKTVLVSGRIPQKLASQNVLDLMRDVRRSAEGPEGFRRSLNDLGKLKPDLWLPAYPVHGQNANLYDNEWTQILEQISSAIP